MPRWHEQRGRPRCGRFTPSLKDPPRNPYSQRIPITFSIPAQILAASTASVPQRNSPSLPIPSRRPLPHIRRVSPRDTKSRNSSALEPACDAAVKIWRQGPQRRAFAGPKPQCYDLEFPVHPSGPSFANRRVAAGRRGKKEQGGTRSRRTVEMGRVPLGRQAFCVDV